MFKSTIIQIAFRLLYIFGFILGAIETREYFINEDSVNWIFLYPVIIGLIGSVASKIYITFYKKSFEHKNGI